MLVPEPKVAVTEVSPSSSVFAEVAESAPPPDVTVHDTVTPAQRASSWHR